MSNIDKLINWFQVRKDKVTYSMIYRNGPKSYDCSSAVYYALIEASFLPKGSFIGNTDTLYKLEGSLLTPITRSQARKGDIFIAGKKGGSGGAFGHTGVFVSNNQIIHCNGRDNGISQTVVEGRTGSPVYYYRLKGSTNNTGAKTIKVGKQASHWANESKGLKIDKSVIGQTYEIMEEKKTNQSRSTKVYLIGKNGIATGWLLEQDVDGFGSNISVTEPTNKNFNLPTGVYRYRKNEKMRNGNDVLQIQLALSSIYFYPNVNKPNKGCDGFYGSDTADCVKRFQLMYGLVADGDYGDKTRMKLNSLVNK